MSLLQRLARSFPSLDGGDTNLIRASWDRLSILPGGARMFDQVIGRAVPYSGSIGARVVELQVGRAVVELPDRRRVRNHLRSIHAIALANLAELTGNLAVAYSMPDDARFIVAGFSIEYLKKARGTIRATCDAPVPPDSTRREYEVAVSMRDPGGTEVARATMRTLVGPKKPAGPAA